ncbi:interferon-induced GTP-binding protein Mx [Xylaria curta]|nr:interferon-induced GTP-binding protein Mx [Xylaria curta]
MDVSASIAELQTDEQRRIIDTIIALQNCGLDKILSLPQIVVCGDQSSGKSSVLEALTEIPFPRSDNLCTRFATQISLRREATNKLTIRVIPDDARPVDEQEKIKGFSESITNFKDLLKVMDASMTIMGISNAEETSNKAFAKDVLSIEIEGPSQPQVTLVDIPGLISTSVKGVSEADIAMVAEITDRYISQPRTICLAVVQASNDVANQSILQRVRKFDPKGERTMGVITKVDDVPIGSGRESQFLKLARNEVVFFQLGWHIVKNRKFEERDFTVEERNASEAKFFAGSIFGTLPKNNTGIETLRLRLSQLLFEHTKNQLPFINRELEDALRSAKTELALLGDSLSTSVESRGYLTQLSMDCHEICRASIRGHYENQYLKFTPQEPFSSYPEPPITRLRAVVQRINMEFAENLRTKGHKYAVGARPQGDKLLTDGSTGTRLTALSHEDMTKWVRTILVQSRGTEVIGNLNPQLLAELFWEQSSPWEKLAADHIEKVCQLCEQFLEGLLTSKVPQHIKTRLWSSVVADTLRERREAAFDELKKILEDNKSAPINYNHSYTDNLQECREARLKKRLRSQLGHNINSTTIDSAADVLCPKDTTDMEKFGCEEALDCLMSLYKVQQKVFLANVTTQVVERHIIKGLDGIFSPLVIAKLSDDRVKAIVAESEIVMMQRNFLADRVRKLEEGRGIIHSVVHY